MKLPLMKEYFCMDNKLSAILKSKIEVVAVVADRLARSVLKARTLNLKSLDINRINSLTH
jgi:hypothetical protein